MSKKLWHKLSVALICLLVSTSLLCACVAKPQQNSGGETEETDTFTPAKDTAENSELAKRYAEYQENSTLAFVNNSPASPESFEYEVTESGVKIIAYTGDEDIVVVPEKIDSYAVSVIASGAFSDTGVRAVSIPDSVVSIEQGAFSDCDGLSTLRLPFVGDGGESAYLGYVFGATEYAQNAVKVPASLDMVIVGRGDIGENAFSGCKSLSAIILPDETESIADFAFYECSDLVFLNMGDGVDSLGAYALGYCRSIFSLDLSGVREIAKGALFECEGLNNVTLGGFGESEENSFLGYIFGADSPDYNDEFVPVSLRSVTLADTCTSIPDRAFTSCKYITSVNLPDTALRVGTRAFYACRSLVGISLDGTVTVGDDAFFGCDNLKSVELGESLTSLGMQAFYGCKALCEITLPQSLTAIAPSTFYGCSSLVGVELGGVKEIGKDAFGACDSLKGVKLDGITVADGNQDLYIETQTEK